MVLPGETICGNCSKSTGIVKGSSDAAAGTRVTLSPFWRIMGSSARAPTRIFGPGRSSRIVTGKPVSSEAVRMLRMFSLCPSNVPWARLSRATFIPAWIIRTSTSHDLEAGPMVETIFVLWSGRLIRLPPEPGAV